VGNLASETFQFVGDSIGEIVIGGFVPGAFNSVSPINGRLTDRLDFSLFDYDSVKDGQQKLTSDMVDVDFEFNSTYANASGPGVGYFTDAILTFKGDADGLDCTIRLVGVGGNFGPDELGNLADLETAIYQSMFF
jgi:hypothetical protein